MMEADTATGPVTGSIRWAFNTKSWKPTEEDWVFASRCIPLIEKERIGKFVFKADAKASMAGCLMIRKLAHLSTGKSYDKINIVRDISGRPVLRDQTLPIDFNVSHQGSYTVLAGEIGINMMVGVDIMSLPKKNENELSDLFRLTNKIFSSDEWSTILASPIVEAQSAMFYRHWCLKESYTKAIGIGICTDLQRISFQVNTTSLCSHKPCTDTTVRVDGEHRPLWKFHEWLLDSHHCVSVALSPRSNIPSNIIPLPFSELSWSQLVEEATPLLPPDIRYCQIFMKKEEYSAANL